MKNRSSKKVIVILGPTSSGKTKLVVKLARKFDGEIISADSRQVYKGMDIGTGKDLGEYDKVKHHLLDVVKPTTEFSVAKYQKLAYKAIDDVLQRGKLPIVCGGTGLYISALVEGYTFQKIQSSKFKVQTFRAALNKLSLKQLLARLKKIDPLTHKIIDHKNRRRVQRALEIYYQTGLPKSAQQNKQTPPYDFLLIGLNFPKTILDKRITQRLKDRLEKEGMINEVKRLHRQGVSWQRLDDFGLEYRFVSRYLRGLISYDQMFMELAKAINSFAKRQMTWFKRNKKINWLDSYQRAKSLIIDFLE